MSERRALTSDALMELQRHVADGLAKIDPHHRRERDGALCGRSYPAS